jgi:hypothetical protein
MMDLVLCKIEFVLQNCIIIHLVVENVPDLIRESWIPCPDQTVQIYEASRIICGKEINLKMSGI